MWVPKDETEIITAVQNKAIEENEIFDAKKELPAPGKNIDLAKDIAAMATEGGVLLYGIAEDEHKKPTILSPIPLKGQPERINTVVNTSIAEPPRIIISTIPTAADPAVGYIVVQVPQSERAPHMVIVKGDSRYYGRSGSENIILAEGQVARLYERRRSWEVDRDALLAKEIENSPLPPHPDFAYLYLFARPVSRQEDLLNKILRDNQTLIGELHGLTADVAKDENLVRNFYSPDFNYHPVWRYSTEGAFGLLDQPTYTNDPEAPASTLNLQVDMDGSGHLFCGRAAYRQNEGLFLYPPISAGNTMRFMAFFGKLYRRAHYVGMVDLGLAITGLKGSSPAMRSPMSGVIGRYIAYNRDDYRRTCRVSASVLESDPRGVAAQLLLPLFTAVSQGTINPFLA